METIIQLVEFIKESWAFLAAASGILGLVYKYIIKPKLEKEAKRKEGIQNQLAKISTSLDSTQEAIKELGVDVAYLQHDRLQQGHDYFMRLGYCPPGDKENLINMYDRYIAQKHNSLYKTYKEDLLELPPSPDGNWGARNT